MSGKNSTEKKTKINKLLAFYTSLNFNNITALTSFEKECNISKTLEKVVVSDAFSLHETLKKLVGMEISDEQKEAAILHSYIKTLKEQKYKSKRVNSLNDQLWAIKSELEEIIKGKEDKKDEVFKLLSELTVTNLTRLRSFEGSALSNDLINTLKKAAIDSEEYRGVKSFIKQREEALEKAYLFDPKSDNVSEDCRTVNVKENASSGERLVAVFEPLLKMLHSKNKEIYMDDVFEKLDTENIEKLASTIGALNKKISITIMTHNPFVYHQIDDVLENSGHEVKYMKIEWEIVNNEKRPCLKLCDRSVYNFEYLNEEIVKQNNRTKNQLAGVWPALVLFSRVFGRRVNRSGSVGNTDKNGETLNTSNYKMYEFTSNNIKHYEPIVDVNYFNSLYSQNLEPTDEKDSIWLLMQLRTKFDIDETIRGISFKKVCLFIDQLIEVLEIEKDILNGKKLCWKDRQEFLEKNWPIDCKINKQERNIRAHRLDQTLLYISETK